MKRLIALAPWVVLVIWLIITKPSGKIIGIAGFIAFLFTMGLSEWLESTNRVNPKEEKSKNGDPQ